LHSRAHSLNEAFAESLQIGPFSKVSLLAVPATQ
jgi:hypothetical protein